MRHSREEKARTHERIVELASQRIRESGMESPGVAEIMQAAGLTHGGFYKHFDSRDDLIAEAAERAYEAADRTVHELTDDAEDPLGAFVDWYVSARHRDDPGAGCPVVALGDDVQRGNERVRSRLHRAGRAVPGEPRAVPRRRRGGAAARRRSP